MSLPKKAVCLLSGGVDSSVLLYYLQARNYEAHALSVLYGQRHACELQAAKAVAACADAPHHVLDLSSLASVMRGSSQTEASIAVPHGHYEDSTMRVTVVPNRNMVLLAVAAAYAISLGAYEVAYAAHAGDHAIYPDCRPEFSQAMQTALGLCHTTPVKLWRPFIHLTKAQIVEQGAMLGAPLHLTYSCYEGGPIQCGVCATCYERREAFIAAGVDDPTVYQYPMPQY